MITNKGYFKNCYHQHGVVSLLKYFIIGAFVISDVRTLFLELFFFFLLFLKVFSREFLLIFLLSFFHCQLLLSLLPIFMLFSPIFFSHSILISKCIHFRGVMKCYFIILEFLSSIPFRSQESITVFILLDTSSFVIFICSEVPKMIL